MESPKLKIQFFNVEELVPYANNAKKHTEKQVSQIAESIKQFGNCDPIAVWHNKAGQPEVVEGHGRLLALKELGVKKAPCICLDHLDDDARRAYTHIHNQLNLNTTMDSDKLRFDLKELSDFEWRDFGFNMFTKERVGEEEIETLDIATGGDDNPNLNTHGVVYGDRWQLGDHVLMCGDSTLIEDVEKLTSKKKMDIALTDPPYGINIAKGGCYFNSNVKNYKEVLGDESTDTAVKAISILRQISKNQIIWGGNYYASHLPDSSCWVVWNKETGLFSTADCELAWTSFPKAVRMYTWRWSGNGKRDDEGDGVQVNCIHPTQKPVGLMERLLEDWSDKTQTVIDLFGGSGSTLIACEKRGQKCYMMERDEEYVSMIIDRWEKKFEKKAWKIND